MTKTTEAQAEPAATTTTTTTDKPRRPHRMAREPGAASKPAASDAVTAESVLAREPKPRADSKIAGVIALLSREQGATLADLVEATGWLPHTTRAALTGLKKKGIRSPSRAAMV